MEGFLPQQIAGCTASSQLRPSIFDDTGSLLFQLTDQVDAHIGFQEQQYDKQKISKLDPADVIAAAVGQTQSNNRQDHHSSPVPTVQDGFIALTFPGVAETSESPSPHQQHVTSPSNVDLSKTCHGSADYNAPTPPFTTLPPSLGTSSPYTPTYTPTVDVNPTVLQAISQHRLSAEKERKPRKSRPIPTNLPPKDRERVRRNRESAFYSREKKKNYVKDLEIQVMKSIEAQGHLKGRISSLENENNTLRSEVQYLRSLMAQHTSR